MKNCKKCGDPKNLAEFNKNKNTDDGYHNICRQCFKQIHAVRYQAKKEEIKLKTTEYYYANLDKCRDNHKIWRDNNKEHVNELGRKYYAKNSIVLIAKSIQWNLEHSDSHRQHMRAYINSDNGKLTHKAWLDSHPDEVHLYKHNYKAKRKQWENSGWSIKIGWWRSLIETYNNKCSYCGIDGNSAPKYYKNGMPSSFGLTPEHMTPLSRGGAHMPDNIVPACMKCQGNKQSKTVQEFGISPKVF